MGYVGYSVGRRYQYGDNNYVLATFTLSSLPEVLIQLVADRNGSLVCAVCLSRLGRGAKEKRLHDSRVCLGS